MREDRNNNRRRSFLVRRSILCLLLSVLVEGLLPTTAPAQFPWSAISTPGYATAGLAASIVPAIGLGWNNPELGTAILGGGLAVGVITGLAIGGTAQNRLARGEELSGAHRNALRAGTVMAGAGIGALASYFVISPEEGDGENDGEIFLSFVASGAALGVLTQVVLESRLEPEPVQVGLSVGPEGRPGIVLSAKF
jgi:hypothetical protein